MKHVQTVVTLHINRGSAWTWSMLDSDSSRASSATGSGRDNL
jgi:hypothetical protein